MSECLCMYVCGALRIMVLNQKLLLGYYYYYLFIKIARQGGFFFSTVLNKTV